MLLASAYAPAALIVGCRTFPDCIGWITLVLGGLGLAVWTGFLLWLPHAQPREVRPSNVDPMDGEVTAYIASYLLPIVAAASPSTGDLFGYGVCAVLVLIVAFTADLGSVNPVVYLFGLRVARVEIDGRAMVILAKRLPRAEESITVARAAGVTRVLASGD